MGSYRFVVVSAKMPETYVAWLEELVERGVFESRSEAIREAVRELVRRYMFCRDGGDADADEADASG